MAHGETRVIMKPNPIISILFIATFFLFGVSAHSENLNEILNQINSDLETKKEDRSTNAGTGGQAKEPAQEESRKATATPAGIPLPTPQQARRDLWIFPDSDRRYLQPAELATLNKDALWCARNEIYVRRGYIFSSDRGRQFAKSFGSVYAPRISGEEAITRVFNPFETANVKLIKNYENAR